MATKWNCSWTWIYESNKPFFLQLIFKQASACQPPTREICCIGPGIVDSVEQDLFIMFTYKYRYILKAWIFFFLRDVDPAFPTTPPGPQFPRKFGPDFRDTGPEIEPRFPAKPLRRKSVPSLGHAWGESNLRPFGCKPVCLQLGQGRVASTAIHLHLLHGHHPRPQPDRSQNPKSKLQTGRLDFGVWILDRFSLRSFCGGPKRPRLDFGFRILEFGFWARIRIRRHRLDPA